MKKINLSSQVLRAFVYMLIDAVIILATYVLGYISHYDTLDRNTIFFILGVIVFKLVIYSLFGLYKTILDHISIIDEIKIFILVCLTNVFVKCCLLIPFISDSVANLTVVQMIFLSLAEFVLIIATYLVKRVLRFYDGFRNHSDAARTLVIGAGSTAKLFYNETFSNEKMKNKIVCYVDDDPTKIGQRYLSCPVLGPVNDVGEFINKYKIEEVVIAASSMSKARLKEVIAILAKENVKIKRIPLLTEMDIDKKFAIKDVSLAELLGRDQITFDDKEIREFITGRRVLVTGGGGSIGSELCRQIFSYNPSELTIFDIYENNAYDIQQELVRKKIKDNLDIKLNVIIGSTYNEFRVEEIFNKYQPEIVFHAAAYKHVPLMEDSPVEAIRTNCLGTYNVAKMADKYHTKKMVLVSTDKAVRPTNTMGATKRFAEMVIQYWDSKSTNTSYSAVRFGNVLGSNGSVIPLFKKQIEEGGPVTVTHKDIVRYFMTIPEAVSLILQSGVYATGGEIFILDMGKPVRIVTLAENVIKQCGLVPYSDIEIRFTGLRPGEKLFEELLIDTTVCEKTQNNKIYIERKENVYPMDENIEFISKVFTMTNNDEIKGCLKQVVTNYEDYKIFNAKSIAERK